MYADSIARGPHPAGVTAAADTGSPAARAAIARFTLSSGRYSARHRTRPGRACGQAARIACGLLRAAAPGATPAAVLAVAAVVAVAAAVRAAAAQAARAFLLVFMNGSLVGDGNW